MTGANDEPLQLVAVPYGRRSLGALRDVIRARKAADPLAPVTVVVPNNFVGIAARRGLADGHLGPMVDGRVGLAAVSFLTIYRLAELLGAARLAAGGRRPVSTPVIAAAVRRALADDPGVFATVAQHPTTERRLVSAHRELSELDGPQLQALAAQGQRAHDVVAIHRAVQAILEPRWYGEQELIASATTVATEPHPTPLQGLGPLVLYLPEALPPSRGQLMIALARRLGCTVIAGVAGSDDADATIATSLDRLGLNLPETPPGPIPAIEVTSVSDADEEVRHVVRGIVAAAREGVAFDRMAVLYATDRPYARLLHDHLDTADIPLNGASVSTLAESTAGRLLRRFLSLADREFRREDVTALLAGSPLRWHGRPVPSRAWDQISREAGVVKGAEDWDVKLGAFAAECTAEIEVFGDDPEHEWRVRRLERKIALALGLQAFMTDLVSQLQRVHSLTRWRPMARWCRRVLLRYVGDQRDWPQPQLDASQRIETVLDRLATLDAVEPHVSAAVFRRSLDLELEGGLNRVGSFGNGVLIGSVWMAPGLHLDHVWIVGLSEGTFPSRQRDDSLLPDRERRSTGVLALRSDRTGDEHRHLLAALGAVGPNGLAHLLRPRGDLRQSDERAPSRWLVQIIGQRLGRPLAAVELDQLEEDWVNHVPSFAGGVLQAAFPPTTQEYDLKDLVDHLDHEGHLQDHPQLTGDGPLALGARLQMARSGPSFTRYDGNLAALDLPSLTGDGRPTSATALETWARCPQQYLMRYLLAVDPLETPEQRLRLDPISRGTLIHTILERFVSERLTTPTQSRGWAPTHRERLHTIASEEFAAVEARGLTGQPLYWRRDQVLLRRDLDAFLQLDTDRRHDHHLSPLATELAFGLRGAEPVSIRLPDGRVLPLRGSIDLVDETDDGDLVVTDYKTGKETRLSSDDPHRGGTKLQLVLYALAAKAVLDRTEVRVTSNYWHIRAKSNYCFEGYEVTPEVAATTLEAVSLITENIHKGVFPQHPEESTRTMWVSCHYCDPDGLGTSDARRRLLRKATATELEDYIVLAEPKLLPQPALLDDAEDPR